MELYLFSYFKGLQLLFTADLHVHEHTLRSFLLLLKIGGICPCPDVKKIFAKSLVLATLPQRTH